MDPLIVYIIGDNRCGSTLLDYLLSIHEDAYSLGEVHSLYDYYFQEGAGIIYNWKCGCGNLLRECSFWSKVIEEINFSSEYHTRLKASFLGRASLFWPRSQDNALKKLIKNPTFITKGKEVTENCWKIYNSALKRTTKKIIIDSSKDSIEAYFRYKFRQGNIKFILLERDIRAVAYSNMNRIKELTEDEGKFLKTKDKSIYKYLLSRYMVLNKNRFIAERLQTIAEEPIIMRINYEDLTKDPHKTINEICNFLSIQNFNPPQFTSESPEIAHTLGGSPSRYEKKVIKPDIRWRSYYKNKLGAKIWGGFLKTICEL